LNYAELVASYWNKIGVDVEIDVVPSAVFASRRTERDFEMISAEAANTWFPLVVQMKYTMGLSWNTSNPQDPDYDAMHKAAAAATTLEEQHRIVKELDQYGIEKFWTIWGPMAPQYAAVQPWVIGYNGEKRLAAGQYNTIFSRLWIDQELKDRSQW
jgi:ABC-type oligopeptide transport system substrate-binding subunit